MRTITNTELKAACVNAYTNRALLACMREDGNLTVPSCQYIFRGDKEGRCAIGAALSDEECVETEHFSIQRKGVLTLVDRNICAFEDIEFASQLQYQHDQWAAEIQSLCASDEMLARKFKFLELIGL